MDVATRALITARYSQVLTAGHLGPCIFASAEGRQKVRAGSGRGRRRLHTGIVLPVEPLCTRLERSVISGEE